MVVPVSVIYETPVKKFVKSNKTGEWCIIESDDMDFNTRFAMTYAEMKQEVRLMNTALERYRLDSKYGV